MATKLGTNLNVNNNQLLNLKWELLSSDPGSPQTGRVWYNTTSNEFKGYNGSSVVVFGAGGAGVNDPMRIAGSIDASTNPNYPAADAGDTYYFTVAGKIGGVSGPDVEVGDAIVCTTDSTASGDHGTVGSNWFILQKNVVQATTSTAGYTRYATTAELIAGAVTDAAVTPAAMEGAQVTRKYTADISASTGATITPATHGLRATKALSVELYEDGAPNARIIADISVADNGDVTWATTAAITGHIVIMG